MIRPDKVSWQAFATQMPAEVVSLAKASGAPPAQIGVDEIKGLLAGQGLSAASRTVLELRKL